MSKKPPKRRGGGRGPDNPSHGIPGRHPGGRTCAGFVAVVMVAMLTLIGAGCSLLARLV